GGRAQGRGRRQEGAQSGCLQTIWQGCDSALAAPLVLDLARLLARAHEAGISGPLGELAFYFKDPDALRAPDGESPPTPAAAPCSPPAPRSASTRRGWPSTTGPTARRTAPNARTVRCPPAGSARPPPSPRPPG
ncbi:hypothetical protein ACWG43_28085, partial [Streptomyces albidoflavus]